MGGTGRQGSANKECHPRVTRLPAALASAPAAQGRTMCFSVLLFITEKKAGKCQPEMLTTPSSLQASSEGQGKAHWVDSSHVY